MDTAHYGANKMRKPTWITSNRYNRSN